MGFKHFFIGLDKNKLKVWAENIDELFKEFHQQSNVLDLEEEIQLIQLRYLLKTHNLLKDLTSNDYDQDELLDVLSTTINKYEEAGFSPLTFSFFISVFLEALNYTESSTKWINPLKYDLNGGQEIALNQLGFGTNIETLEDYEITGGVLHSYKGDKAIVYIPNTVIQIAEYAFEGNDFKAIIIPDSVKSYGEYTFKNCKSLELIKFEKPISDIPKGFFYGCQNLTNFEYTSEIKSLGENAFCHTNIRVFDDSHFKKTSIAREFLKQLDKLEKIFINDPQFFSKPLENIEVDSLNIGPKIEEIPSLSINKSIIKSMVIEAAKVTIHSNAFFDTAISQIEMKDPNYKLIDDVFWVFDSNLRFVLDNSRLYLNIPEKITHISAGSINRLDNLEKIIIGENIENIQKQAINQCNKLHTLDISLNDLKIFEDDFIDNNSIKNIIFNNEVSGLISTCFPNVETISLRENYKSIKTLQFSSLNHLKSIRSDYIQIIDDYAFFDCNSLEEVDMINATYIGFGAFSNCESLNKLRISTPVDNLNKVIAPKSFASLFNFISRSEYQGVEVDFNTNKSKKYFIPSSLDSIQINGDSIPEFFYKDVKNVEIKFLQPLKNIGKYALYGTDINEISLADDATIGDRAFGNCHKLSIVDNLSRVSSVEPSAVENCESLIDLSIENALFEIQLNILNSLSSLETLSIKNPSNTDYTVSNNIVFDIVSNSIIFVPPLFKPTELALSHLNQINQEIMAHFSDLRSIEIDHVGSIEDYSFQDLNHLEHLQLGPDILKIGSKIIDGLNNLKTLNLPFLGSAADQEIDGSMNDYYSSQKLNSIETITISGGKIKHTLFNALDNLITLDYLGEDQSIAANAFSNLQNLKEINFKSSINEIGDYAFYKCHNLDVASIILVANHMGDSSFEECHNISEIQISDKANFIGKNAFKNAINVQKISIFSDEIEVNDKCFNTESYLTYVNIPIQSKSIEDIFGDNAKIEHLKIRASSFQSHFMSKNDYLTKLTINGAVNKIPENAFSDCKNLKLVNLNNNIRFISFSAFENCKTLKTLHGSEQVEIIQDDAFKNCTSLEDVYIPNIIEIGKEAFKNCTDLSVVQVGEHLERINSFGFCNDVNLSRVTGGINLRTLNRGVFQNCEKLEIIELGKVQELQTETFDNCKELKQVTIPYTCRNIGTKVFDSCTSLKQIKLPISVDYIDEFAFYHSDKMMVVVVDDKKQTKTYHKYWNYIHDDILEIKNPIKKMKLNFTDRFRVVCQVTNKEVLNGRL